MKILFLFLVMLLTGLSSVSAQKKHISLKKCDYDTLKYIDVNFIANKARYEGHPVQRLLDDLDFEIKDFIFGEQNIAESKDCKHRLKSLYICYITSERQKICERTERTYYVICVVFEKPYQRVLSIISDLTEIYDEWRKEYYDLIKNLKVKRILVMKMPWDRFKEHNRSNLLSEE